MDDQFIKVYTSYMRNTPWIFSETLRIIEGFNEGAIAQNTDSVRDGIPPTPSPLGNHKVVLYICDSISALQISSSLPFF